MISMKTVKIEGIATFEEKGFHFDSGMPSNEPVLEEAMRLHGTLEVSANGCADFTDNGRIYLPPEIHRVSEGMGYKVKRTSRHYLIQLSLPVVESRMASEERITQALPVILGDITLDRRETLGDALQ